MYFIVSSENEIDFVLFSVKTLSETVSWEFREYSIQVQNALEKKNCKRDIL